MIQGNGLASATLFTLLWNHKNPRRNSDDWLKQSTFSICVSIDSLSSCAITEPLKWCPMRSRINAMSLLSAGFLRRRIAKSVISVNCFSSRTLYSIIWVTSSLLNWEEADVCPVQRKLGGSLSEFEERVAALETDAALESHFERSPFLHFLQVRWSLSSRQ